MNPVLVHPWLLLLYKIPREPSAARVFVWRNLKQLGAILLHDAAWVLPATAWTRDQLAWLAAEVEGFGGEATVWEARLAVGERRWLVKQFLAQVDAEYADILAELGRDGADLDALTRRYEQVRTRDYFQSHSGEKVRAALQARRDDG